MKLCTIHGKEEGTIRGREEGKGTATNEILTIRQKRRRRNHSDAFLNRVGFKASAYLEIEYIFFIPNLLFIIDKINTQYNF